MNYISIHLYRKVLNHALTEGMRMEDFTEFPTPVNRLDKIQAVPADHFFELHELVDQKLGSGFSVRVGQQMKIEDYGVLGLSWKTCSKAGEIFERSERYFTLLSNTYVFKVETDQAISKVYLLRDSYRRGIALSNEATLSATVVVLKAITGTLIKPLEVCFTHSAPQDLSSYVEAFDCPLRFQQARNYIAFQTSDLERRTIKADQSINAFLVERVEEATNGIQVDVNKLVADVERIISDALPSGIPSIDQVSAHLGMSNRTLTRRLSERNTTFREIIKKTQEEISKQLLRASHPSIGEIAFQTGFSEQSAFNRAFKRWTGQSPTSYRKSKG